VNVNRISNKLRRISNPPNNEARNSLFGRLSPQDTNSNPIIKLRKARKSPIRIDLKIILLDAANKENPAKITKLKMPNDIPNDKIFLADIIYRT
jgi:hypothetical protein